MECNWSTERCRTRDCDLNMEVVMVRLARTHYKSCNKQGASPGSSCMPYLITYMRSLMRVLGGTAHVLLLALFSCTTVHGTCLTQLAIELVQWLCSALLRVVSHRIARLLDYATVHGTLPPGRCKYETLYLCYIFLGVTALGSHR